MLFKKSARPARRRSGRNISFQTRMMIQGIITIFLYNYIRNMDDQRYVPWLDVINVILMFAFVYLLHQIIREVGRLLMGLILGFRLIWFNIDFWHYFAPATRGRHLALLPRVPRYATCQMEPGERTKEPSVVLFQMSANLTTLLITTVAVVLVVLRPWAWWVDLQIVVFAVAGLLILFLNGVPRTIATLPNDARVFEMIQQSPLSRKAFFELMRLDADIARNQSFASLEIEPLSDQELTEKDLSNLFISRYELLRAKRLIARQEYAKALPILSALRELGTALLESTMHEVDVEYRQVQLATKGRHPENKALFTPEFLENLNELAEAQIPMKRLLAAYACYYRQDRDRVSQLLAESREMAQGYTGANVIRYELDQMIEMLRLMPEDGVSDRPLPAEGDAADQSASEAPVPVGDAAETSADTTAATAADEPPAQKEQS